MRLFIISTIVLLFLASCSDTSNSGAGSGNNNTGQNTGQAGSRARFTISGNELFTLNSGTLQVFDISRPADPLPISRVSVPGDVETLFAYKDSLYIGAENGMLIYTQPSATQGFQHIGTFSHALSCDPVVVEDDLAFLTTRFGSSCRLQTGENALRVIDISNPGQLVLTRNSEGFDNVRQMIEPSGLGVDGDKLFVCDGAGGLKLFDVLKTEATEGEPKIVDVLFNRDNSLSDIDCYDVIPIDNTLIVSNGDEVRQFDYSLLPMEELGRIK